MKYIKRNFFVFLSLLFFQACASKNENVYYSYNNNKSFPNKSTYDYQIKKNLSYSKLYDLLNSQYKNWKGAPYKYGGNTRKGIDCSAFVQRTFKEKLNIKIPRTTALQSKIGINIPRENLRFGDLVFFKTGYNSRHVGIYLEGGKFLHASTKRGVTISRLDNNYYSKHFWKIKRVLY